MTFRLRFAFRLVPMLLLLAVTPGPAAAQGYRGYPYSIMTPEGGSARRHHGVTSIRPRSAATLREPATSEAGRYRRGVRVARGSSGSVLPTPLPRTKLIPPEGNTVPVTRALPQEQPPTVIPGTTGRPIPNLPHGAETFQDRASRCATQQSLYGVPGTLRNRYMGACLQ